MEAPLPGAEVFCPACGAFVRRSFYPLIGEVCRVCGAAFAQASPDSAPAVRLPEGLRCPSCGALLGQAPPGTALMCLSCGAWAWEAGDRKAEQAARELAAKAHRPSPHGGPLPPDALARVRALVRAQCSAYQGGTGRCAHGRPCVYFSEDGGRARCRWFELAVLPLDQRLMADYCDRPPAGEPAGAAGACPAPEAQADGSCRGAARTRPCAACGREFAPASNRQRYCPECAADLERQRAAERKARQRARAAGPEGLGSTPGGRAPKRGPRRADVTL